MGTPSGFDLTTAATRAAREDEGQELQVRDADGQPAVFGDPPKPVIMRVAGTYSKVYAAAVARQRDTLLRQRRTQLTGEALTRQQLDLAASCVLAWDGFFDKPPADGGVPLPCTRENAVRLFTVAPWVLEQVQEAMGDHAAFFGTNSSS